MGRNTQQMADLMPLETNEKITLSGGDTVHVVRLLGEGGFSYVFLAQNLMNGASDQGHQASISSGASLTDNDSNTSTCNLSDNRSVRSNSEQAANNEVALKVTSIHSREARDVAAKEVSLLKRMRHPNILRLVDVTYVHPKGKKYPLHLIALEYCNGGTALDVVKRLREAEHRFHWQQLIIIFGQIANAVTYLHAQRPSIVHRDLKLENFLVHQSPAVDGMGPVTTYKLCDFGSAVIGSIDISSNNAKRIASDIIEKTTSQLYRAPEMCDLYLKDELTEKTDVWALGCSLFSLAFCKDCFDENSNLAILSGKYKIPEDNQYGEGLEHLISRMLTIDYEDRADMPEVISCLSALYAKKPLPLRKVSQSQSPPIHKSDSPRKGFFRTDGQGFKGNVDQSPKLSKKVKILNPNSAAARRRKKKLAENAEKEKDCGTQEFPTFSSSKDFESSFIQRDFSEKFEQIHMDDDKESDVDFRPLHSFSQTNDAFDVFQSQETNEIPPINFDSIETSINESFEKGTSPFTFTADFGNIEEDKNLDNEISDSISEGESGALAVLVSDEEISQSVLA